MMALFSLEADDVVGLAHPFGDAHTLGVASAAQLLEDAGIGVVIAGDEVCRAIEKPSIPDELARIGQWVRTNRITCLGFSYRLDPDHGAMSFQRLVAALTSAGLLNETGGPIRGLYFAGLPAAAERVRQLMGARVVTFRGDESTVETLTRLGIPKSRMPACLLQHDAYEQARLDFGHDLIMRGAPDSVTPIDRTEYGPLGSPADSLQGRVAFARRKGRPPLMRAHVGPYRTDRRGAVEEFIDWCHRLARSGYLDVLSIGTSQLTQEALGEDWAGRQNGGGVPIATEDEFREVYRASRPMLVRTYAGTKSVPEQAEMHERNLNNAWHALSLWWFSQIDGRGPNSVFANLSQHFQTLNVIARFGKPFEPNVPHHFAFRGADDVTYCASSIVSLTAAKQKGVRYGVLQNMMNTPNSTWGVQDLAKARVMLKLARELEDERFTVFYQPRAGLSYFSPDLDKARVQLAAVTALMDDVEPGNDRSPDVIHVVSYTEASHLADPAEVDESIRITRAALSAYRQLRRRGESPLECVADDVAMRTEALEFQVRRLIQAMESSIPDLYTPFGLYQAFWAGFFPTPDLWECRSEFRHAVEWRTRLIDGGVVVVDERNFPLPFEDRIERAMEHTKRSPNAALLAFGMSSGGCS